jgi:hypothetical protein
LHGDKLPGDNQKSDGSAGDKSAGNTRTLYLLDKSEKGVLEIILYGFLGDA